MSQTKFNKYQYVELLVNPGQSNPGFTPQQYLQNRQIYSFEVFTDSDVSMSRSSNVVATPAMIEGMFLNLYCTDVQLPMQAIPNSNQFAGQGWGLWFRDVPLIELHRMQNFNASEPATSGILFEMFGEFIDFEQSYVNINATAQALITAGGVPVNVIFGVGYK
jgi:hypothetical protein